MERSPRQVYGRNMPDQSTSAGSPEPGGSSVPGPIDPNASPKWALAGRIVTMDGRSTVVPDGAVWISDATIAAITSRGDPAPPGFEGVVPLETAGTLPPR